MTQQACDEDLDGILDGALEAYDVPLNKSCDATPAKQPTQTQDSRFTEGEAAPDLSVDDITRAFEDALKDLGRMGADTPSAADDDVTDTDMKLVEEFIKSLGSSMDDGGARGNERSEGANVEKIVENLVEHILSKDVLQVPMVQMRDAYKVWLPKNKQALSDEQVGRYTRQQQLVEEICQRYQEGADNESVLELLSKMQETGSPPEEIMKQVSAEGEGTPELDRIAESCRVQ